MQRNLFNYRQLAKCAISPCSECHLVLCLQLGHGDFSSANTKVLRMVNTLAVETEAKQTIEALQNELQKTKEKLLAVEELKKQSCEQRHSLNVNI